jgi:5-methylcytosine-specific restriction endonuclease McrA
VRQRKFSDEKAVRLALYGTPVLRPCIEPGCTQYAVNGGSRCLAHRRSHARKRWDQQLTGQRGSRGGWRRLRAAVIRQQRGRCATCGARATVVHHIDGNARNDGRTNLVALCDSCHLNQRIEAR